MIDALKMNKTEISKFTKGLIKDFSKAELESIFENVESQDKFIKYQSDPEGFCRDQFKEDYTDDIVRMFESVRDNVITIAKSGNATGKSHGSARVAVWWKKCFPNSQVYTAAAPPEENLKKILWGEIGSIVSKFPKMFQDDRISTLNVITNDLEFITGVAIPSSGTSKEREAKFSGKHAPNLLFILDEGDAVPDEVYAGIESCMSGGNVRLLVMFNPRAAVGAPYRMERDKAANIVTLSAMDHPNVKTGKEVIPGAVNRETTVRRVNDWCRPLHDDETYSDSNCFVLPVFLEGCRAKKLGAEGLYPPLKAGEYKIINPAFSYMVLAQYPGQAENQLISREWVDAARKRYDKYVIEHGEVPQIGVRGIQAQDVAEDGADKNVCGFKYDNLVLPFITWSGVDTIITGQRASREYHNRGDIDVCKVDAIGVGSGVAPYMIRHGKCQAIAVKVSRSPTEETEMGEFNKLRDQLHWSTREWLRTEDAMIPPDEGLMEELLVVTYKVVNGKIVVMSKDDIKKLLQRSPDKMDTVNLFFAPMTFTKGMDLS